MARDIIAGRYRLLSPLGGGAMASVWLAEDAELGRRVAVKLLGPNADRARFEREARSAAALAHPNICQLYDYGEDEGRPYMVLEYLAGGSLAERLRGVALPDDETARIAREIAQGLAHAHQRGLVHRDLKPANILFDSEGRAKIADFGIARMGGTGTLTAAGTVLGTAAYISPEQARGEKATPASDVYSFGVMLFLMLTGRLPFEAPGAMELAAMHRDRPPPPVSAFRPDAPVQLADVAEASLAKDPRARPADGAALAAELGAETFTALGLPLTGEPTQVIPRARPGGARRRRLIALAVAGAGLLLAAGIALAFLATDSGSNTPAPGTTLPNISAPSTSTRVTTAPTTEPTTAPTTTEETTTAGTTAPTTAPTTSTTAPTTQPTTTAPATTAPTTTAPTTTAPTTAPTETTTPTDTLPVPTTGTTVTTP